MPDSSRPYVEAVLDIFDPIFKLEPDDLLAGTGFADRVALGVEHRTAGRRLLARLAGYPPAEWSGPKQSAASHAAAIAWLVWKANDVAGRHIQSAKGIAAAAGLRRVPYDGAWRLLAKACPDAPEPDDLMWREPLFADPRLLVSVRRGEIIRLRDDCQSPGPGILDDSPPSAFRR